MRKSSAKNIAVQALATATPRQADSSLLERELQKLKPVPRLQPQRMVLFFHIRSSIAQGEELGLTPLEIKEQIIHALEGKVAENTGLAAKLQQIADEVARDHMNAKDFQQYVQEIESVLSSSELADHPSWKAAPAA